jgi:hypothetical protein
MNVAFMDLNNGPEAPYLERSLDDEAQVKQLKREKCKIIKGHHEHDWL